MPFVIFLYVAVFFCGLIIGSFLNVLVCRMLKKENMEVAESHCKNCDYQLKWYDSVPLFGWFLKKGKCHGCGRVVSARQLALKVLNGGLYVLVVYRFGVSIDSLLYCLLFSALLALSDIDFRTYEIPVGFNYFILTLGLIHVAADYANWVGYVIGFFCVSIFLFLLVVLSDGRAMGGGDVKLMATCGLLIGWKLIILAFFLGCILGSVIHITRMKVSGKGHVLAMGPYLSMGVALAVLFGNQWMNWYLLVVLGM